MPPSLSHSTERRPFVVVTGIPGSGKTTLARRVGLLLALEVLDKDDILESLFEARGVRDWAWRRILSRTSDELLAAQAAASNGAMLVSFWRLPGMPRDSGTPTDWLRRLPGHAITLQCVCAPEVAAARFLARSRHPGHLDAQKNLPDLVSNLSFLEGLVPLHVGEVIVVDTAAEVSAEAVAADLQTAFRRRGTSFM